MYKLYFAPGACSLAPHIALEFAGVPYESHQVDLKIKKTTQGEDFNIINPKSQVPTFKTREGATLTECAVILQYIADQAPEKKLLPAPGTWERYKAQEWLNYIATELHKGLGLFFAIDMVVPNKEANLEARKNWSRLLAKKFDYLSQHFSKNAFFMGDQFSVVDAYAFAILNWHGLLKIDLTPWPTLMGFMERVQSQPQVQKVMRAEGLLSS